MGLLDVSGHRKYKIIEKGLELIKVWEQIFI